MVQIIDFLRPLLYAFRVCKTRLLRLVYEYLFNRFFKCLQLKQQKIVKPIAKFVVFSWTDCLVLLLFFGQPEEF